MKRFFCTLAGALIATLAFAIPARPGTFRYTQPDGTVVELRRHGDEFFHWTTLASTDQVMVLGEDGFYRPGVIDPAARAAGRAARARVNRLRAQSVTGLRSAHNDNPITHGEHHIPVLLVEFSDLSFGISNPSAQFDALLNQKGYSANGATGSVQDYYTENSGGEYVPVFDVYGPVKLSQPMSYYGSDDSNAAYAVSEAATLLDSQINFADYDSDNDGSVDMILMYYPGYNEAEGGPANSIWPHQWYVFMRKMTRLDGKLLARYFCTSEYKGSNGSRMCGIGTTTHEFGHSLGLPDFYDTDYEENDQCGALYSFSTMCSGSYNNDSRTPPYFNAEERKYLGWMSDGDIPDLPGGSVRFGSIKDGIAYKSPTDTEGEYFLYECRDGSGWDAPLPKGLLVYHADKSKTRSVGGISPYEHWTEWESYNAINAYGNHPCFYIIPSFSPSSLYFPYGSEYIIFPGGGNVKTYSPVDWNGNETGLHLSEITFSGGLVSMTVQGAEVSTDGCAEAFSAMGFNMIHPGSSLKHKAGEVFALKLVTAATGAPGPSEVRWVYDGSETSDESVVLTSGTHLVQAVLTLYDGKEELLELELEVE